MEGHTLNHKRCSLCKEHKPTTDFHKNKTSSDGLQSMCKPCKKAHNDSSNPEANPNRMYVNGQYVSSKHPLHKPGRYIIDGFFGEAKVESAVSKQGYVYCITNPAWPGWVKVGKAVEDAKRFNSYQTYSPFRDYTMEWSLKVDDVHSVEAAFHRGRKTDNGEWHQMTVEEAFTLVSTVPHAGVINV